MKKKDLAKKIAAKSYIYLLLLLMYLPVLVLVVFSFTDTTNLFTWNGFTFQLYVDLFKNEEIMLAIGNTLLIALISSLLAAALGTFAAIGVHELGKKGKRAMEFANNIPVVNPEIVIALSLIIMFVFLGNYVFNGFEKSFWTLLVGHLVLTTPFVYLSVKPKILQLDPALYEAALDLGCTPSQAMRKVTYPAVLPGVLSGFMLAFTLSLDDFIITAFLTGPGLLSGEETIKTISTYVQGIIKKRPLPPEMRALCTLILVVVIVVVFSIYFFNRKKSTLAKKRKGRIYG